MPVLSGFFYICRTNTIKIKTAKNEKGDFFAKSIKKAKNAEKITAKITSKVGIRRKSYRINMR